VRTLKAEFKKNAERIMALRRLEKEKNTPVKDPLHMNTSGIDELFTGEVVDGSGLVWGGAEIDEDEFMQFLNADYKETCEQNRQLKLTDR
jgi:hypothetical protein